MKIDVTVTTPLSSSVRAQQVSAMFDVPPREREAITWTGELPLEDRDWTVGLIVGPSGSGKTTVLNHAFGTPARFKWRADSVLDDFDAELSIADITAACSAVGFNTIPAWLRPHKVLSTGEQFRVALARALLETPADKPVVIDEFTSVVDRQVAKIGAHAAQKYIRRNPGRRLVAATCHFDVIDWLQPDWTFEPATIDFGWRCLQRRPELHCEVRRVHRERWQRYAPFHYLTAGLNHTAACYELTADGTPAAFSAILHRPQPAHRNLKALARTVCLPDWQGLGIGPALSDYVAAAYTTIGYRVHAVLAHPGLIRTRDRSPNWELISRPGPLQSKYRPRPTLAGGARLLTAGRRPTASFRYVGPRLELETADALISSIPEPASARKRAPSESSPKPRRRPRAVR